MSEDVATGTHRLATRAVRPARRSRPRPIATASRVRGRLARLGGRAPTSTRCSSRCCARSGAHTTPRPTCRVIERAYAVAERAHEGQMRKSGDPYITHPLAVAQILAELGMTAGDAGRGAAARHGRGHRLHARRRCAATSATRSRCSSTASPSSTRSSTATRPRPRPSARWSSRCRATSACWSSSSPTGCTTRAPGASSRGSPRSARPARPSRSTRRWPTGSA